MELKVNSSEKHYGKYQKLSQDYSLSTPRLENEFKHIMEKFGVVENIKGDETFFESHPDLLIAYYEAFAKSMPYVFKVAHYNYELCKDADRIGLKNFYQDLKEKSTEQNYTSYECFLDIKNQKNISAFYILIESILKKNNIKIPSFEDEEVFTRLENESAFNIIYEYMCRLYELLSEYGIDMYSLISIENRANFESIFDQKCRDLIEKTHQEYLESQNIETLATRKDFYDELDSFMNSKGQGLKLTFS